MTLTSEVENAWVHIQFHPTHHSDWTDAELLDCARDSVFYGTAQTSLTPQVPVNITPNWGPVLSIEVIPTGPYNDNMDRLAACDKVLVKWAQDLRKGLGVPFDREVLFSDSHILTPIHVRLGIVRVNGEYAYRSI